MFPETPGYSIRLRGLPLHRSGHRPKHSYILVTSAAAPYATLRPLRGYPTGTMCYARDTTRRTLRSAPWPSPPPVPACPACTCGAGTGGRQARASGALATCASTGTCSLRKYRHLQPAQVQTLATCASTSRQGRLVALLLTVFWLPATTTPFRPATTPTPSSPAPAPPAPRAQSAA